MTMARTSGSRTAEHFYDEVGALRDVVQNHLLQVLALTAMEPPAGNHPDSIRDKKLELLKAIRPADPEKCVRGQYEGYREIDGVALIQAPETYVALELEIDNWRWSGFPLFVRAVEAPAREGDRGRRRLPPAAPARESAQAACRIRTSSIVRIDPKPAAPPDAEQAGGRGGSVRPLRPRGPLREGGGAGPSPYERLLADALSGRQELFMREDMVEESWRIVQPLLENPPPIESYPMGTWGPDSAKNVVRGVCEWYEPWLP